MEADVLNALTARAAYFTGGRDRDGRWMICVPVPGELQPWSKRNMELAITYLFGTIGHDASAPTAAKFALLIDTQKSTTRQARLTVRHIEQIVDSALGVGAREVRQPALNVVTSLSEATVPTETTTTARVMILVVRSDAFWDKQLVDNCTKPIGRRDEPATVPKSRLDRYFDVEQLPDELGGRQATYDHDAWMQQRQRIDEFQRSYEKVLNDLENVHVLLLEHKAVRAADVAFAVQQCATANVEVQRTIEAIIATGNTLESDLIELTAASTNTGFGGGGGGGSNSSNSSSSGKQLVQPDLIDYRERLKSHLNAMDAAQTQLGHAWREFQHSIDGVQKLGQLEERIMRMTDWFLGTAEKLLAAHTRIGCDVSSSEALRRDHEHLELQCSEPLGAYAELLQSVKVFPLQPDTFAHNDLMSQKDFMDFVCRSFAGRMERRKNVLITCSRFYRLVSEYFDKTSEVFETLVLGEKVEDFAVAAANLKTLTESQEKLDKIMRDLEKEGEKLSDILTMPVKDALGRDCGTDYSEDIATIREILDATLARRRIFLSSVVLQKLRLEQVTHIHAYEQDATVAHRWIGELFAVMCKTHLHVGCNVFEIQTQKDDLQTFIDTAKGTYNFGCQLLSAAATLRHSCKLSAASNTQWLYRMNAAWTRLHSVSQEQMTRLRVSAVFYRSIDEYCEQLLDLRRAVINGCCMRRRHRAPTTAMTTEEASAHAGADMSPVVVVEASRTADELTQNMRKFLARRERLLVDVGRMVRLGRLLKTRLREPFDVPEMAPDGTMADANSVDKPSSTCVLPSAFTASSNAIACDAIAAKLTEVTKIAESLDSILCELQDTLDEARADISSEPAVSRPVAIVPVANNTGGNANNSDDWSHRSSNNGNTTEEELFVTASEGTTTQHSRSSSYRTASDGGGSRASPWWSSPVQAAPATHPHNHHHLFDADSSEDADIAEVPSMQMLTDVASAGHAAAATTTYDAASDVSFRSTDAVVTATTPTRQCTVSGMDDVGAMLVAAPTVSERRHCASAHAEDVGGVASQLRMDAQSWSMYCGNVLTKQTLKGCL